MITEFFDSGGVSVHDQFQAWRTNHQDGLCLSLATRTRANLHGARCLHFGSGPPYFLLEDGFGSLTIKRKVCGSEEELIAWATENGVSLKYCHDCLRDNLIGDRQVQEGKEEIKLPEEVASGSAWGEGSVRRLPINRYEGGRPPEGESIRTTLFTWGFWGWGNSTRELKAAVKAAEETRGFAPPFFVDIRYRRSGRAPEFVGDYFKNVIGGSNYRWEQRLGNPDIGTGPEITEHDRQTAAGELLDRALVCAKSKQRIIFFCACVFPQSYRYPDEYQRSFCHRDGVAELVCNIARKRGLDIEIVEWPGFEREPRSIWKLHPTYSKSSCVAVRVCHYAMNRLSNTALDALPRCRGALSQPSAPPDIA